MTHLPRASNCFRWLNAAFMVALASGCATPVKTDETEANRDAARLLLRCHHFYSTTIEDARLNKPEYFVVGHPFLKIVNAAPAFRIVADVLVGDRTADDMYRSNVVDWSSTYRVATLTSQSWGALTNYMTKECRRVLYEVDPAVEREVEERLRQRGITL